MYVCVGRDVSESKFDLPRNPPRVLGRLVFPLQRCCLLPFRFFFRPRHNEKRVTRSQRAAATRRASRHAPRSGIMQFRKPLIMPGRRSTRERRDPFVLWGCTTRATRNTVSTGPITTSVYPWFNPILDQTRILPRGFLQIGYYTMEIFNNDGICQKRDNLLSQIVPLYRDECILSRVSYYRIVIRVFYSFFLFLFL